MKIGYGSTSQDLKCVSCKKTTSNYKTLTHSGLELEIPVCGTCEDHINTDKSIASLMTAIKTILTEPRGKFLPKAIDSTETA